MSSYWNVRLICDGVVAVVIGVVMAVFGLWIWGVVFLVLGIVCLWMVWRKKNKSSRIDKNSGMKKMSDGQYYPTQENEAPA